MACNPTDKFIQLHCEHSLDFFYLHYWNRVFLLHRKVLAASAALACCRSVSAAQSHRAMDRSVRTKAVKSNCHHLLGKRCPTLKIPWAYSKLWQKKQCKVRTCFKNTAKYNCFVVEFNVYISMTQLFFLVFFLWFVLWKFSCSLYHRGRELVYTVKEPVRLFNIFSSLDSWAVLKNKSRKAEENVAKGDGSSLIRFYIISNLFSSLCNTATHNDCIWN